MAQDDSIKQATKNDLESLKEFGIALTGQIIRLGEQQFIALFANYINDEWQLTQRPLG